MKYFVLSGSIFLIGTFVYLKHTPGFKFFKPDTSNFKIGINQGKAYIKNPNGKSILIPTLKGEKNLELIWSKNHQEIYLLKRTTQGTNQLFSVNPITGETTQKTFTLRPKSHLQAVSKNRVTFKSGNEILIFSCKNNKMKGILPPFFINQTPESRAKIFSFYHHLDGQLIDYKVDPKLKEIRFKWKDPFNQINFYTQPLTLSENTVSLPIKQTNGSSTYKN